MNLKRRNFIHLSALATGATLSAGFESVRSSVKPETTADPSGLLTGNIQPISANERKERITKAQSLLLENNMEALIIESGTAMEYFTGISWWPSERTMAAIIPAKGEIIYVCPGFEESRFRELITIGNKVYVWQEDESPYRTDRSCVG